MPLIPSSLVAVFVRLGWTHLSTRPGRTLLTTLGVGLGVAATIAVQTANVDVLRSFEESVLTVAGPATLEVTAGEAGMDEHLITAVRDVAGVESARPVVEVGVRVAIGAGRFQSFRILGVDLLDELNSMKGRLPASLDALQGSGGEQGLEGLLTPDGILVGQGLALEIDAKPEGVLALEFGGRDVS
ncbi:MAG: ABC transporter permease, partial [Nitrospira sp.]